MVAAVQGSHELLTFVFANALQFVDVDGAMRVMGGRLDIAGEALNLEPRGNERWARRAPGVMTRDHFGSQTRPIRG